MLLGLYVVLTVLLFDPKPATFGDNAVYLILGKSLAEGTGYREQHLPGAPPHSQYPPGFPLILAAITLVSGGVNVLAAKLFVVLTGIGAMFFVYRICRLVFPGNSWPVMVAFASLPALVVNNHWVLSEIPFLFVSMAAVYCLVLTDRRHGPAPARLQHVASALAVGACLIRTSGLALVLAMTLLFLVRRQYRQLIVLILLLAVAVIPWQVHNLRAGDAQPYLEQLLAKHPYFRDQGRAGLSDWALRVWQNLRDYVGKVFPRMLFPVPADSWLEVPTGIVLFLLTAIGFRRGLAKFGPLESWAVFAAVVVLAWPNVWSGERFLLPFLPLVVIFLLSGLDWLGDRLGWRPLVPVFVALLVLANAVQMVSLTRKAVSDNLGYLRGDHYSGYPEDWRSYFQSIDWVKANTSEDAVIMARKPEFVYLLSGRRSFCYPFSQNQDDVKSAMLRSQYILADNFQWTETTPYFLGPVLKANPELWEMAFRTPPPEFYVLRIRTGS